MEEEVGVEGVSEEGGDAVCRRAERRGEFEDFREEVSGGGEISGGDMVGAFEEEGEKVEGGGWCGGEHGEGNWRKGDWVLGNLREKVKSMIDSEKREKEVLMV